MAVPAARGVATSPTAGVPTAGLRKTSARIAGNSRDRVRGDGLYAVAFAHCVPRSEAFFTNFGGRVGLYAGNRSSVIDNPGKR